MVSNGLALFKAKRYHNIPLGLLHHLQYTNITKRSLLVYSCFCEKRSPFLGSKNLILALFYGDVGGIVETLVNLCGAVDTVGL